VLECPPGDIISPTQNQSIPQITVNMTFSCRSSDSSLLGPHLGPRSILLNAAPQTQTSSRSLWPTSEMNRALSLPKLEISSRWGRISGVNSCGTQHKCTFCVPSKSGSWQRIVEWETPTSSPGECAEWNNWSQSSKKAIHLPINSSTPENMIWISKSSEKSGSPSGNGCDKPRPAYSQALFAKLLTFW
jgi:hypothetical protein